MITTPLQLRQLAHLITQAKQITFDLEADSLRSFPERICLFQICIEDRGEFLVDPIAIEDMTPLLEAMSAVEWIVHGSDYDLRLLRRFYQYTPPRIFDTQEAARLIGMRQFGLGALTKEFLDIELDKKHQRADWTQRPLSAELMEYARTDARVLTPLAERLLERLEALGRVEWHRQVCDKLVQDAKDPLPEDPDKAWRIKGSSSLSRPALGILRELWKWRDSEARAANKPPFFILNHDRLVEIAKLSAEKKSVEALFPKRFSPRRRKGILAAITQGRAIPYEELPPRRLNGPNIPKPQTEAERGRLEILKERRDEAADRLDIDATVICNKATLEALAVDWGETAARLLPWQQSILSSGASA